MAKIEELAPIISKWEGKFVDHKLDKGGATNMGITIGTWKQVGYDKNSDGVINTTDIKLLNQSDFKFVLKKYWDRWKADEIVNQSIANILVDWVWGSGKWGIVKVQELLGLTRDGVVGKITLSKINESNQQDLFLKIYKARLDFLNNIVKKNPSQRVFIKGWKNRLADFKFTE